MIDVKQAVQSAVRYVQDLYESKAADFRLEEVELSEDDREWLITVSFDWDATDNPLKTLVKPTSERQYKVLTIDSDTGEPRSMKIRQFQSV